MLATFAANLWQRLRVFEAVIGQEEERFDAAMQDPGEEPPRDGQDIMDRCYYIAMQLAEFVHEFPGLRVPVRKPRSGGTS